MVSSLGFNAFVLLKFLTMTTDVAETSLEDTTYTYDRPQGTTSELVFTSPSSWTAEHILPALLVFMCCLAFVANLAMLICLLVYKQVAKKTINVFACNQTILDLLSSFFYAVKFILLMSGYLKTKTGVLRTCTIQLRTIAYNMMEI